jgi:hypothetical protein
MSASCGSARSAPGGPWVCTPRDSRASADIRRVPWGLCVFLQRQSAHWCSCARRRASVRVRARTLPPRPPGSGVRTYLSAPSCWRIRSNSARIESRRTTVVLIEALDSASCTARVSTQAASAAGGGLQCAHASPHVSRRTSAASWRCPRRSMRGAGARRQPPRPVPPSPPRRPKRAATRARGAPPCSSGQWHGPTGVPSTVIVLHTPEHQKN